MFQLNNYMHLSPKQPANTFADDLALSAYSRGMGALGLPGDLSSASRFVRVAFTRMNARSGDSELESGRVELKDMANSEKSEVALADLPAILKEKCGK
jgi:penicillin V acylase-like amidase (Ntn superfamily)